MELTATHFLVVCPLVFIAGFIDAIAGGGGLITLPAYLLVGLPVHNAIATNKMSSCLGTTTATVRFAMKGCVKPLLALCSAPAALLGSSIGAELALRLDDGIFKIVMLFILPPIAWFVMRSKNLEGGKPLEELPRGKTLLLAAAIAFTLGVYDGFYGPGAGTFLLLLLSCVVHLDLNTAAGTTKVINLSTNIAALAVYLVNGKVLLPLGLAAGLCSMAGNWLGVSSFAKKGTKLVRPVILTVLTLFFIKIITELLK